MYRGSVPSQLGSIAGRYRRVVPRGEKPDPLERGLPTESPSDQQAPRTRAARLEAVLWLADGPLSLRRLAKLANLAHTAEARSLLETLRQRHQSRARAFEITEVAGGFQLLTKSRFAPWISKFGAEQPGLGLSTAGLETLAVVAHMQPVLRAEIEAIRGVGCADLLRQLLEGDLLRIVGRSEELGKPLLYGTTSRFLQVFGLRSLDDLPQPAEGTDAAKTTNNNATERDSLAA